MGLFENQSTGTTTTDDLYSGIDNVQTSERDANIVQGVYPLLYVDTIKVFKSQRSGSNIFVASFDIIESDVANRPKGTSMSLVMNYSKHPEVKMRNIKEFLVALNDCSDEDIDSTAFRLICSDKNPCHGKLIRLEAVEDESKTGARYMRYTWRTIDKNRQEQAEELRKQAGFTAY